LFAGRLNPVKRPLLLVEIAAALRRRRRQADFRFVVAGDGPEAGRLAHRIARRKLKSVFELLGHVPDIAPELARCDLLLLPSESEGIPLVVLEAFASAKPVVATAVGGVPEVVNESNGFAIPANGREVQAFAEAIDTLLWKPELRQALGEHGRSMVTRDFTYSASRDAYRALFRLE
jgi:glycosyltransferase involved in cell wall biosynthesis